MFKQITSFEQLVYAFDKARRVKREKPIVAEYEYFLEEKLLSLQKILKSGDYSPLSYTHFTIFDPKNRRISAPAFRDRIVQHSIVKSIEPIFEKQFISDSYACRKGKGTHFGAKRIKKFLMGARCTYGKNTKLYVLQCDIHKFFQNIKWDTLLKILYTTIQFPQTRLLIEKIVKIHPSYLNVIENEQKRVAIQDSHIPQKQLSLFDTQSETKTETCVQELSAEQNNPPVSVSLKMGLPIGNLTSQLFANIYLNQLDQYVKHTLKEKWYARYMDDFLIIHHSKKHLRETRDQLKEFLEKELSLQLHPRKITIKNVTEGLPFVGYRIFYDHILVRGDTLRHMQRKYKKRKKQHCNDVISEFDLAQSKASISGHLKHANAYNLQFCLFGKQQEDKKTSNKKT